MRRCGFCGRRQRSCCRFSRLGASSGFRARRTGAPMHERRRSASAGMDEEEQRRRYAYALLLLAHRTTARSPWTSPRPGAARRGSREFPADPGRGSPYSTPSSGHITPTMPTRRCASRRCWASSASGRRSKAAASHARAPHRPAVYDTHRVAFTVSSAPRVMTRQSTNRSLAAGLPRGCVIAAPEIARSRPSSVARLSVRRLTLRRGVAFGCQGLCRR